MTATEVGRRRAPKIRSGGASRDRFNAVLLGVVAALVALVIAVGITSVVLALTDHNPYDTLKAMVDYGVKPDQLATTVNAATTYYLSAIAVAVAFRMNLFNIGVDGQYQLAAIVAAAFGGQYALPNGLHQVAIILVAMAVGSAWAGIIGVLKVTRGVSEVISSIMLNFIATAIIAYLILPKHFGVQRGNDLTTKPIGSSGQVGGISLIPGSDTQVYGLVFLAVVVGVGFQLLVSRTRFGFDLRATGRSTSAAQASGVNVKRMVVVTMLISGAVAGLVNMPVLLGEAHNYSLSTPSGIGFTGIAIALLGRNNPIGIVFAALLWGFLDTSSNILQITSVPSSVVSITEGVVVLSAVVAYELVRRYALARQQRRVGRELAQQAPAEVAS
ncbi:ABC transporter permease [uncultured Jatrophihabitans sp.]|uniref:ABC transporter permease n=1 Tax=uncultured Jatrophihabitans sp. TaxID=1610747 RepID=UPI0035CA384C